MRNRIAQSMFVAAAISFSSSPVEAETAKEIVEKAIAAHGGLDNLKKYPAAKVITKGKATIMNFEIAIEGEDTFQMPDQFKTINKVNFGGQKTTIEQIFNGGKMKMTVGGGAAPPFSDAMKEELKSTVDVQAASEIYPLLDEKRFELSVIEKPAKVADKDVVGILVKTKAGKQFKIFFDAKTFMMAMIERKGIDFMEQEVNQEMRVLGYKKIDGIQTPTKYEVLFDGKKAADVDVVEYKHLEKVDKKEFDISD